MERRKSPRISYEQGELTDEQLDQVSGGTEVVKLGKITVTGKRDEAVKVAKLEVKAKKDS